MSPQVIIAIVLAVLLLASIVYTAFQRRYGHYRSAARRKHG